MVSVSTKHNQMGQTTYILDEMNDNYKDPG